MFLYVYLKKHPSKNPAPLLQAAFLIFSSIGNRVAKFTPMEVGERGERKN